MYSTFRKDMYPRILASGVCARAGEGIGTVGGIGVDVVWR